MGDQPVTSQQTVSRPALLKDGNDAAFRQMLHDLLAFSGRLQQIRNQFGAYIGLSGPQYTILITIRQLQEEAGVGVSAVAEHLSQSAAFVTAETNKLAKLGVIDKRPNPDDLRRVLLGVTERGESLLAELAPAQREVNDQLFDPVTPENFDMLATLSRALRDSAEQALLLSDYLMHNGGAEK